MTQRWLHEWFPLVGMLLQTLLWAMLAPRLLSDRTLAVITFSDLPEDPEW